MPIIHSAIKTLRQAKKRTEANRSIRTAVHSAVKGMKKGPTAEKLQEAFSVVDRAVKRKVMHKNKAARMKSSLSKMLSSGAVAPKQVVETAKKTVKTVEKVTKTVVKKVAAKKKTSK